MQNEAHQELAGQMRELTMNKQVHFHELYHVRVGISPGQPALESEPAGSGFKSLMAH